MPTMRSFRATGASEQSISSRSGGGGGGRPPHTAAPPNEGPRLDVPRRAAAGIPPGEGVVIPPGGPPASRDASAAHERAMASSRDSKLSSGGGSHSNTGGGAWAAPAQTDLCSPTGAGEAKCPVVVAKAAAAVASAEAAAATRAGRLVDGRDRRSLFCRCPAPQTRLGAAARQYMPRTRTPGRRGTGGTAPATEPNLDASSAAEANRRRLRGRPSAMASHFKVRASLGKASESVPFIIEVLKAARAPLTGFRQYHIRPRGCFPWSVWRQERPRIVRCPGTRYSATRNSVARRSAARDGAPQSSAARNGAARNSAARLRHLVGGALAILGGRSLPRLPRAADLSLQPHPRPHPPARPPAV
eukprot:scaffold3535_cov107-Isochrysis_galbana.AAC.5